MQKNQIILSLIEMMLKGDDNAHIVEIKNTNPVLNKICIVRTYSAGVYVGQVVDIQEQEVVIKNARNIHSWTGAKTTLDMANNGISTGNLSGVVDTLYLSDAIAIIPCTDNAIAMFDKLPKIEHKF